MIWYLLLAAFFIALHIWIFRWLIDRFSIRGMYRFLLAAAFAVPPMIYLAGEYNQPGFTQTYGYYWVFGVESLFLMTFFEIGMSRIILERSRLWRWIALLSAPLITLVMINFVLITGDYREYTVGLITGTVALPLSWLLYNRLSKRIDASERGRGYIILFLWAVFTFQLAVSGLVAIIIFLWMYYFIFYRISSGLDLDEKGHKRAFAVFGFIFVLSFPITSFAGDFYRIEFLVIAGAVCLGFISIAFAGFFVEFLISSAVKKVRKTLTIITSVLVVGVTAYSTVNGLQDPVIKRFEIPVKNLPEEFDGTGIVQITDIHLGSLLTIEWFEGIIETANSLDPDIVVITGDIFERDFNDPEGFTRVVNQIDAPKGVYAVTGNHEYFYGLDMFYERMDGSGIILLENESAVIDSMLYMVGINDDQGNVTPNGGPDIEKAFAGIDPEEPIIFLSHRPDIFDTASQLGADLQLSGHTHAGQIPPLDLIVQFYYKYPYGLYEQNGSYLYTSSGTGHWGTPLRLFSRTEIIHFTLISQ